MPLNYERKGDQCLKNFSAQLFLAIRYDVRSIPHHSGEGELRIGSFSCVLSVGFHFNASFLQQTIKNPIFHATCISKRGVPLCRRESWVSQKAWFSLSSAYSVWVVLISLWFAAMSGGEDNVHIEGVRVLGKWQEIQSYSTANLLAEEGPDGCLLNAKLPLLYSSSGNWCSTVGLIPLWVVFNIYNCFQVSIQVPIQSIFLPRSLLYNRIVFSK